MPQNFQPSPKNLVILHEIFNGRIVGFFRFNPAEKDERVLLQPFACGKMFLAVESRSPAESILIGYLIDYDGRYILEQIPVILETPASRGK